MYFMFIKILLQHPVFLSQTKLCAIVSYQVSFF